MRDVYPAIRRRNRSQRAWRVIRFWSVYFVITSFIAIILLLVGAAGYVAGRLHTHHDYQIVIGAFDDAVKAQQPFYFTPGEYSYRIIPKGKKLFLRPRKRAEQQQL